MESKKLSFPSILLMGITLLIGAGIFLTPGKAYASLGLNLFWLLAVCAVLAIIMALVFAEMAGIFTRTGGVYVYVSEAFGPFLGFNIGFMRFIAACVALAVQMVALPQMLGFNSGLASAGLAIVYVGILCGINMISVKAVELFVRFTSYLVLLTLFTTIIVGFFGIHLSNFTKPGLDLVPSLNGPAISSGFLLLFYAFVGFENIGVAAQDMENPTKDVPKAIITVLIVVTAIYFLLFVSIVGTLGTDLVNPATNANSAAATVGRVLGPVGEKVMLLGAFIALTGIGFSMSFAGPRNLVPIAKDNFLPAGAGANNERGVPAKSIFVMFLVTAFFIFLANFMSKDTFGLLVKVATIARLLQYIAVCLGIFRIRKKGYPGTYKLPAAGLLVSVSVLVCLFLFTKVPLISVYLTLGLVVGSFLVYILYANPRRKRLGGSSNS